MKKIKAFITTFSRRFKVKRLTPKDYLFNQWYRLIFFYHRIFKTRKFKNNSTLFKKDYELIFVDNFKEINWNSVGNDKWKIGEQWGEYHPGRPNTYFGAPKLKKVDGEIYTAFTSEYNPKEFNGITIPYESSWLTSCNFLKTKYGRFECRMTLPDEEWSWPAFWLWGSPWPPEIDIIEAYGWDSGKTAVYQEINMHYGENSSNREHIRPWIIKIGKSKNLTKEFYEFAMEWSPNNIEIFTNGIKIFQYTKKEILDKWFNQPMWVVINNNVRNLTEHKPNYYSEFLVDYIRVYKHKLK
jgi:beta-glucanase (GH16 family)